MMGLDVYGFWGLVRCGSWIYKTVIYIESNNVIQTMRLYLGHYTYHISSAGGFPNLAAAALIRAL